MEYRRHHQHPLEVLPDSLLGTSYHPFAPHQQQMLYLSAPPPYTPSPDVPSQVPPKEPDNQPESNDVQVGELSCATCHKVCKRPCDLTKHLKTHTRPHKCPVAECKYSTQGWATEKECERHINDKHNPTPALIRCSHCGYTTKRLSNVKQHMEKTHKVPYHRSKGPASKPRVVARRAATKSISTASTRSVTTKSTVSKSTATKSTVANDYESVTSATEISFDDCMDKSPLAMSDKPSHLGMFFDLMPAMDITSHTAGWSVATDTGSTMDTSVAQFDSDLAQVELSTRDGPADFQSAPVCVSWAPRLFGSVGMDQVYSAIDPTTSNDLYDLGTPLTHHTHSQHDEYICSPDAPLPFASYDETLYPPNVAFSYFPNNYYVPDTHTHSPNPPC